MQTRRFSVCCERQSDWFWELAHHGKSARIEVELIRFLRSSIDKPHTTNSWLKELRNELIDPWKARARTVEDDWYAIDEMISKTEPSLASGDISLAHLSGRIEGSGRLNLSTLHSAKGREFDAVILFAMDRDVIPTDRDRQNAPRLREARRLFYVGVTRARNELYLLYTQGQNSQWVKDLYDRKLTF